MIDGKRDDFSVYPRTVIQEGIRKDLELFGVGFDLGIRDKAVSDKVNAVAKNFGIAELSAEERTALWF